MSRSPIVYSYRREVCVAEYARRRFPASGAGERRRGYRPREHAAWTEAPSRRPALSPSLPVDLRLSLPKSARADSARARAVTRVEHGALHRASSARRSGRRGAGGAATTRRNIPASGPDKLTDMFTAKLLWGRRDTASGRPARSWLPWKSSTLPRSRGRRRNPDLSGQLMSGAAHRSANCGSTGRARGPIACRIP